jgi:uncharacterized membrane protein
LGKIKNQLGDQIVLDGYYESNPMKLRLKWVIGPIGVLFGATYYVGGFVAAAAIGLGVDPIVLGVSWIATLIIIGVFGWQMPKLTEKGAAAYDHAKGFQEYITRAEKYRIQWQEKENVFERFLPYAMVFGVSEKWAKAFEGIAVRQPDWYEGSAFRSGVFNAAVFSSAFNSFNSSMRSAVVSRPSQSGGGSGFSGGGFSGGGGGGGGGGSW